jgi:hypothetical protein
MPFEHAGSVHHLQLVVTWWCLGAPTADAVDEDRMIPPPAQRAMSERAGSTVTEASGSHAIYVSRPEAVADLIKQAASR